jgi:hypothetical protein
MLKDPTPAKIIEKDGEFVAKWCEFMAAPTASGPFAALDDLKETLAPIFSDDLAQFFLPWAAENLENSLSGNESFTVTLGKEALTLAPLRSAARSFRELRRKFLAGQTIEALKAFTNETGSTAFLLRPPRQDQRPRVEEQAPERETVEGEADGEELEAAEADIAQPREGDEAGRKRRRRRRRRGGRGKGEGDASAEASAEGADGDIADGDAGEPGDDDASGDQED